MKLRGDAKIAKLHDRRWPGVRQLAGNEGRRYRIDQAFVNHAPSQPMPARFAAQLRRLSRAKLAFSCLVRE